MRRRERDGGRESVGRSSERPRALDFTAGGGGGGGGGGGDVLYVALPALPSTQPARQSIEGGYHRETFESNFHGKSVMKRTAKKYVPQPEHLYANLRYPYDTSRTKVLPPDI